MGVGIQLMEHYRLQGRELLGTQLVLLTQFLKFRNGNNFFHHNSSFIIVFIYMYNIPIALYSHSCIVIVLLLHYKGRYSVSKVTVTQYYINM